MAFDDPVLRDTVMARLRELTGASEVSFVKIELVETDGEKEEYSKQRYLSLVDVLGAFMMGATQAYAWHWNYTALPGLTEVAQALGTYLQSLAPADVVVRMSINDVLELYSEFVRQCPEVQAWGEIGGATEGEVRVVFATDRMESAPCFVSLAALVTASGVALRNMLRAYDDFDRRHDEQNRRDDGQRP